MRVLMVTRGLPPATTFGGPGVAVLQFSRALQAIGHNVTIYCSNLAEGGGRRTPYTLEQNVDGVRVVFFYTVYHYRFNAVTPNLLGYCRKAIHTYDVVNIYGYREFMTYVVGTLAHWRGVPYVIQPLGNVPRHGRSLVKKWIYDAFLGRSLLERASLIVARSELEREQLVAHGQPREKLAVVPNGLELEEFTDLPPPGQYRRSRSIPSDAPVILFVGRIARIKSLDLLIEAVARLKHRRAWLEIVGPIAEPEYERRLRQLVKSLGLMRRAHFRGPLVGREKLAAYVDADVTVLPSEVETFGLAAAESVAAGSPVIVTEGCGLADTVRDRVGLVVPHDAAALASALDRVLTDAGLRARLRQNCPDVARSMSIEHAAARLEEVLLDVVARRAPEAARATS